jgi:hypothetical protein
LSEREVGLGGEDLGVVCDALPCGGDAGLALADVEPPRAVGLIQRDLADPDAVMAALAAGHVQPGANVCASDPIAADRTRRNRLMKKPVASNGGNAKS